MSAGIIEAAVKAILPDLITEAEKLARAADEALPLPPMIESLLVLGLGMLTKRGVLKIETTGEIHLTGHKRPHPEDT